jgi:hypothetical protein
MAGTRDLEPGCLMVDPSRARFYHCKLAFSVSAHPDGSGPVLMLALGDDGCRPVRDWTCPDDPNGLAAEVTCWP